MVIIVFKTDASKEFLFPNTTGLDYQVYIDDVLFGLEYSFFLSFENYRGQWRVVAKKGIYDLIYHKTTTDTVVLDENRLFTVKTNDGQSLKVFAFDQKVPFRVFHKYSLVGANHITVGKNQDNVICYDFMNMVSGLHCVIELTADGHTVSDFSANGVFVNNRRVERSRKLVFGDTITIFGLKMVYLNEMIAVDSHIGELTVSLRLKEIEQPPLQGAISHKQAQTTFFNRSPRRFYKINNENVVIEPPNNLNVSKKRSLLFTIGPSFTMAIPMLLGFSLMIISSMSSGYRTGVFMYTGLITAVGSALFGALWAVLNLKETKQREYDEETRRFNAYGNYLMKMGRYIEEKYEENRHSLLMMYPPAEECCTLTDCSSELWNRNETHEDFLFYRLGLGDIDFQMHIRKPEEKFTLETDALKEKPTILYENFKTLKSVPVGIDCAKTDLFGIIGSSKYNAYNIVNLIISQIAATTSYTDAKIVFCFNAKSPKDLQRWDYIKWLPHTWSENRSMRYFATDKQEISEVIFELSNIMRQRADDAENYRKNAHKRPHYFLFLANPKFIEGELITKYVFDKERDYGLTTFLIADHYSKLPNECEDIIECDSDFCGVYNTVNSTEKPLPIAFDTVKSESLDKFAKRLSGISVCETEEEVGLVSSLTFFEMQNIQTLEELDIALKWRKNKTYNTMRALIGRKAGGADCYLDIHEKHHGPHGLIAGTTGSGKSEFICTFLLSLAINYSPDDIAFFIIDFKGGGMGNSFLNLPHIAGQISNLSGNQIKRAMISVKSENTRRQKLFSDYGVNNISGYTQLYKSGKASQPMPHLLIVIDEFAELKKEEPEFMKELISVAQVGRSLGVHLILATQKPAGTVDDNIWSNSKFRICLRVQDRQDSNDMLHKPDAAFITQAGRGYLQIGNDELYELFQSGWSGAIYKKETESVDRIATMITHTGHTAIVGSHTLMKQKQEEKFTWYRFLTLTTRDVLSETNVDTITDEKTLCKKIIERSRSEGYHLGDSESDYSAVTHFVHLMPNNISDIDETVRFIMAAAAEKNIQLPEITEKTQLEATVEYINRIAAEEGYSYRTNLWMPLLPAKMYLEEIIDFQRYYHDGSWAAKDTLTLSAEIGMYDDPWNQNQLPLTIDFLNGGHLAVCGTVVSGKSTLLQTLLFALSVKYSPQDINYYILDFSGGMLSAFSGFPHAGGVIRDNEPDKTGKFFNMMAQKILERKQMLDGGSFQQYRKSKKGCMPALFVVIDNFASFKEKTENAYEDILVQLSREGESYGIYLILTSAGFGMSEIQNRIGDNIRTVVSLEMSDKFKYMDVLRTTRLDIQPEPGIKGRGLAYVENSLMEFQTVMALKAADDYQRITLLESIGVRMSASWSGFHPQMIPFIPEAPKYEMIAALPEYRATLDNDMLPYAYRDSDAGVYSIELARVFCYCITGKRRTGKTNVMKLLMSSLKNKKCTAAVIENNTKELKLISNELGMEYLSDNEILTAFFKRITPTLAERNQRKREMMEEGASDARIYEAMQEYEPIFVFISDFISFVQNLNQKDSSNPQLNNKPFFENIFEKGYLHNVFFFACINTDDAVNVAGDRVYNLFTSYKTGVHLGGNLSSQRIFSFQNVHYSLMSKTMKKGEGLVPDYEDESVSHKIIIPLYGEQT